MEAELTRDSVLKQGRPVFSETDARAFIKLGPEAAIFAILTLVKWVAELAGLVGKADPSAPSGQTATFLKPKTKGRRKKPGLDTPVPFGKHPSQTKPCRTASNAALIAPAAYRNGIQVVPGSSRTSRRFQAFGHRACALPVLVFALPEKGGASGGGRSAGQPDRAPGYLPCGDDALPARDDAEPDSGCLQLPPAFPGDRRRPCPGMAPHGRDLPALVRRHPGRHQGTGCIERRRDGMAGAGSDDNVQDYAHIFRVTSMRLRVVVATKLFPMSKRRPRWQA